MTRDQAITRINDAIGFRPDGHSLTGKIINRLIEAQRDLEKGKTLPRFLLVEDADLVLPAGEHDVEQPERFIRIDDDNLPHYFIAPDAISPIFLKPMRYSDALRVVSFSGSLTNEKRGPRVMVVRNRRIDFIARADREYVFKWNYYRGAMTLETNVQNFWLEEESGAPEWLIGEAGLRIAADLRDATAAELFSGMIQKARSACFGDIIADEDAGGPLQMGTWL